MKRSLIMAALVGASFVSVAQAPFCDAESRTNESVASNPQAALNLEQLEKFTQEYLAQDPEFRRSSSAQYVIPVVVHIMHDYTASSNIKKANVLDAIRILNRDFNVQNSDTSMIVNEFKNRIGGLDIQFRLAQIDPQGNCTDGITRHYTELTNTAGENVKMIVSWDTDKYYNIWVVKSIASGAGGYAYIPGTAPSPSQEGVVCLARQFGSLAPSGGSNLSRRTLTHETGHYLSLRHTWGPTNNPGSSNNCSFDDGVDDTPYCAGVTSGCPTSLNSCNDTTFYGFDQIDNVQNYMDYSSCERMFTIGQAEKMDAALNSFIGSRKLLWQPTNLTATGVEDGYQMVDCIMKPDFMSSKTTVCLGSSTTIHDLSWNGTADSWNWTITGPGAVSMSGTTDSVVTATFNTPGEYKVKLEVTNTAGTAVEEREGYISVISNTPSFANWNMENFDSYTTLPSDYMSQATDTIGFELNTNIGWYTSPNCVWLNNYKVKPGSVSNFIIPTFEVPNTISPVLTFDYAYAKRTGSSSDELKVYVSSNCGTTWVPRLTLSANDLNTLNQNVPLSEFQPSNIGEWKSATVNLSAYKNASNIAVRFEFTSGQGNNFYMDNLNVKDGTLSMEESLLASDLKVIPNPVTSNANLEVIALQDAEAEISVINLMGKTVLNLGTQQLREGENLISLNFENKIPAGVYMVRMNTVFGQTQKRFVIAQ